MQVVELFYFAHLLDFYGRSYIVGSSDFFQFFLYLHIWNPSNMTCPMHTSNGESLSIILWRRS